MGLYFPGAENKSQQVKLPMNGDAPAERAAALKGGSTLRLLRRACAVRVARPESLVLRWALHGAREETFRREKAYLLANR